MTLDCCRRRLAAESRLSDKAMAIESPIARARREVLLRESAIVSVLERP